MTFSSEANAKFCLDFFRRLRKDHPTESILFSPLNMSAALHLLLYGSRGDSAAEIEEMLHISDEKEVLSPESRENSENPGSYDALEVANYPHDKNSMSTEAPEEYITDAEGSQDGTGQVVLSTPLAEEREANERPSVLDLERDARQRDRSLTHTSMPTDSQSTSDEGASSSTARRESKNPGAEDKISPQCVLPSYVINEAMNNLVQTLEDNSSTFDSDASSDFLPWSADYPEREDEVLSQGQTTPEDDVFDNLISSPKNKQVSFLNTSDTTNPSHSFSATEGTTRLNNDNINKLKYLGNQMTGDESGGEEGNSTQNTKKNYRQQFGILGHNMEYSLTSAEFHNGISSSHNLPWYKYLLGRKQREALRQACYQLLGNLTAPPESRMYYNITRM